MATRFKKTFKNCEYRDYKKEENKTRMLKALEKVRGEFGKIYPMLIGGLARMSGPSIYSYNPSKKEELIGLAGKGDVNDAEDALDAATEAFESWKRTPIEKRVDIMMKAKDLLIERRDEFNAWCVFESGQTWAEADGEVAETVDFFDFYSRHAERLCRPQKVTAKADEEGYVQNIPLGVGAIIPPWNYPFTIPAGLVMASLLAGNTVVLKPASDTPVIAAKLVELLMEAGLPEGVVNFVPGSGLEVGNHLVNSPKTRYVGFTGSKEVGLEIYGNIAKPQEGQIWMKRLIAEMGGKNAHIVDSETNLELAVTHTIMAFAGRQGQKCSSCSRAIVDEKVYDEFIDRLIAEAEKLKVGPAENFANHMGPVINQDAFNKVMRYIEIGRKEGTIVFGGSGDCSKGYFIKPTIIQDVAWNARIAKEEIFGPVLAVIKARDFDDALRIANSTEYGLTGAVFTENEEKLRRAAEEYHTGNLYLNRKCTGALVGVHPFGGFNHSGTDSKTGGPDYVGLFMQPKTIARKVR
ncbi:MAG: L-glutamate gamma-semialdehyde dehydrogenase [Nanoarchaeota archaeon]|nr:L-glutamate gamma-semialdehyde dehydrogenase [Nanoarchaeota archaeon]